MKKFISFLCLLTMVSAFNFAATPSSICNYYEGKADEFFSEGHYDWGWDVLTFVANHYPDCFPM